MSEKEFKKKQIEKCYMVIHIIKRPVKLKNDGIIKIKEFYSIIEHIFFDLVLAIIFNLKKTYTIANYQS